MATKSLITIGSQIEAEDLTRNCISEQC